VSLSTSNVKHDRCSNNVAGNVRLAMDVESVKLYIQNIEEYVIDEDKIVS
jgi:hypothetical protein